MACNIHIRKKFWEDALQASKYVTDMITYGYTLPFLEWCPPFLAKNNASSRRHPTFVKVVIKDLMQTKCIMETLSIPYCCNPLTVSESINLRLILDLLHVNTFIHTQRVKYEDLKVVAKIFPHKIFCHLRSQKRLSPYFHSSLSSKVSRVLLDGHQRGS